MGGHARVFLAAAWALTSLSPTTGDFTSQNLASFSAKWKPQWKLGSLASRALCKKHQGPVAVPPSVYLSSIPTVIPFTLHPEIRPLTLPRPHPSI